LKSLTTATYRAISTTTGTWWSENGLLPWSQHQILTLCHNDQCRFIFADGQTAIGCSDSNNANPVFLSPSGTRLVDDLHISCSDDFLEGDGGIGFGEKGSPVAAAGEAPVTSYYILQYELDGGTIKVKKECCEEVIATFTPTTPAPTASKPIPLPVPTVPVPPVPAPVPPPTPKPVAPPPTLPPEVCSTPDLTSPIEIPDNCNLSSNKYYYRYVVE
jgi:hypothetical protein